MKMNGKSYFVGGRKDGGKWTWLDGSSIQAITHWGQGKPLRSQHILNCFLYT